MSETSFSVTKFDSDYTQLLESNFPQSDKATQPRDLAWGRFTAKNDY